MNDKNNSVLVDLPTEFQSKIASILAQVDENSRDREQLLRLKLEELYQKFRSRLEFEKIEEGKKQELLTKARKQIELFFPPTNV